MKGQATKPPNRFAVTMGLSGQVQILGLVVLSQEMARGGLAEDQALELAAWIVATCPEGARKFERLLREVRAA